jgi:hypothetical protein
MSFGVDTDLHIIGDLSVTERSNRSMKMFIGAPCVPIHDTGKDLVW